MGLIGNRSANLQALGGGMTWKLGNEAAIELAKTFLVTIIIFYFK